MTPQTPTTPIDQSASLRVRMSPEMVARFAELTGDRSSLHVDDAFARRSAYRQPIVHGMLPVACLSLLPTLHTRDRQVVPVALSARFAAPVFRGDELRIIAAPVRTEGSSGAAAIDYRIDRNQETVTHGTLSVTYRTIPAPAVTRRDDAPYSALLRKPIELNTALFEDITVGDRDVLEFAIDQGAVRAFLELMAGAAVDEAGSPLSQLDNHVYLPNLLSMLLYSTSVGVSLPGTTATFLECSARVERLVEMDTAYQLRGRVTHRSAATRIIKKELIVALPEGDETVVQGKASVLVARPPRLMPTIADLRADAQDFGLEGKVVLVTGASRGIGETTAKLFALHGSRVIVNFHRGAADAERVVGEIRNAGGEARAIAADVSDETQVTRLVKAVSDEYGGVDVLVNNAARDYRPMAFQRLSWDDVQRDLDVILKGAFLCCQAVIPTMLERGGGRIINISTIATDNPPAEQTKYVVAKSALVGLTRSLAVEFAAHNIQVNLVVPNFVETDFVAHIPDGFRQKIARDIPMQRLTSPVDVARAVVVLASNYSSFTTGQKVMVTGGGPPYL